ncbi:MAG: Patatin, partial [Mesorhizobium sp.]
MLEWASLRSKPDLREANGPASSGGLPDPKSGRKTGISLALGGGCARGWAHIG